jgi:ribosomal protein S27E
MIECSKCKCVSDTARLMHGKKWDGYLKVLCQDCANLEFNHPEYILECPHCDAYFPCN